MTQALAPNAIWTTNFKGQFRTRDGCYCYPLTVQDMHSRFLLGCQGLPDVSIAGVKPVFTRLFREFGLPNRIRSDNGAPFASNALGRLSQLSVWFVTLGITPELIEPASPYQNGKHETCTSWSSVRQRGPHERTCELSRRCSTPFAATTITYVRTKR